MSEGVGVLQEYESYIDALFAGEDEALRSAREEIAREGLPLIYVSASEGKLLQVLARSIGARRVLEIGTLGGYSAIWLARGLQPGGRLVSLEIDPHHAEVARRNLERAGLGAVVEVRVGSALESLQEMRAAGEAPFDLLFIDADKDCYLTYLREGGPLVREGGLILADNALPNAVLDAAGDSGAKRLNAAVAADAGLPGTIVPVLRGTHVDGLLVAVKAGG